jgi:hypothetical protein
MKNLLEILNVEQKCIVDKRITKVAISNFVVLNATEKKVLKEAILEMRWLASYKPFNSGIAELVTKEESYDEVQLISVGFEEKKYTKQVINLLQKSMPYPLVLFLESENDVAVSIAKKTIHKVDKTKRVIEDITTSDWLSIENSASIHEQFLKALDTTIFNRIHLKQFYLGFEKAIIQYKTALLTGDFSLKNKEKVKLDAETLGKIEGVEKEIILLKNSIKKETVFREKMDVNIKIKSLEAEKKQLIDKLAQ